MIKQFDIGAALNTPHFQATETQGVVAPDPKVPTKVKLTLNDVIYSRRNPRQSRNPKYEDIKASIRARGLDEKPQITREKPTDPYMIKRGGNTRLEILNELWDETQDEKYFHHEWEFVPWPSEGDLELLIGGTVENESRGDMMFIDRAIAAFDAKILLEEKLGKPLSTNALSKELTSRGWSIDHSNLGQLLYAHETLFPVIPETFWNGLGIDSVKKIRKILANARTYWDSVATPEEGTFEAIWTTTFAAMDGDVFDIADAQNQLEADIATRLDAPFSSIRAEIQAIAQGISPGGVRPEKPFINPGPLLGASQRATHGVTKPSKPGTNNGKPPALLQPSNAAPTTQQQDAIPQPIDNAALPPTGSDTQRTAELLEMSSDELMGHAYGLAFECAYNIGLDSLVELAPASLGGGLNSGYYMLPGDPHKRLNELEGFYYVSLYQLSAWFVTDHLLPEYALVSTSVPIDYLGLDRFQNLLCIITEKRALLRAASLANHPLGKNFQLLDELELTIGILCFRKVMGA